MGLQLLYHATRSSTTSSLSLDNLFFAKSRHLDPTKLAVAKAEFSAMDKAGITRRSTSPWASPLHKVKKKDRGWKPCGHIADFTSCFIGSTVFSKLD